MSILSYIMACLAGGALYRIGGSSLNIPMKTKFRDWGVPAVGVYVLVQMLAITSWWYYAALVGFFLASFGSFCTYWDYWSDDNVQWYEWALTGFVMGLAALPIAIYTGRYIGFTIRTLILTVFMPFSNKLQFKVLWDPTDGVEGSRGFVFIATMPLLLL